MVRDVTGHEGGDFPPMMRPAFELPPVANALSEPSAVAVAPSFDEVYEAHFDFVWRSVRRLGVDEAGTDDAVQEVFLVVHRRLAEFCGRSELRTWIYGIARYVAIRHRRTARRRVAALGENVDPMHLEQLGDAAAPSAYDQTERGEALKVLEELLGELDDDKREVLTLVELEEMSIPEVADVLGINRNTAYGRLRAARQEFEKALARHRARERTDERIAR
ncbi:MAG: hypothetical protein JWM74_2029 [Myxococcaceae bacterium]|nr:hypothetical protein [Myxococcaceae bacterium]